MKILQVIKKNEDGTLIARIAPSMIGENPTFEVLSDCQGYHDFEMTIPECKVGQGSIVKLMACDVNKRTYSAIFEVIYQGKRVNTVISLEHVRLISGNLGTKA